MTTEVQSTSVPLCSYHRLCPLDQEGLRTLSPIYRRAVIARLAPERFLVKEDEVAGVILALCSGLLDGMSGQVLTVDKGSVFAGNIMRLYAEREALGL